jgi:hypothetical protein
MARRGAHAIPLLPADPTRTQRPAHRRPESIEHERADEEEQPHAAAAAGGGGSARPAPSPRGGRGELPGDCPDLGGGRRREPGGVAVSVPGARPDGRPCPNRSIRAHPGSGIRSSPAGATAARQRDGGTEVPGGRAARDAGESRCGGPDGSKVEDHQVGQQRPQALECLHTVTGGCGPKPRLAQRGRPHVADDRVIVGDQDPGRRQLGRRPRGRRRGRGGVRPGERGAVTRLGIVGCTRSRRPSWQVPVTVEGFTRTDKRGLPPMYRFGYRERGPTRLV